MSAVDIGALVFIILGGLHGLWRGLSGELANLASIICAFIFGIWFMPPFAGWLEANTRLSPDYTRAVAFLITVFTALLVLLCVRYLVRRVMKVVIDERFDRSGGVIAGILRATVVLVIVFVLFNLWPNDYLNRKFGKESLIGTFIMSQIPGDIDLPKDIAGGER